MGALFFDVGPDNCRGRMSAGGDENAVIDSSVAVLICPDLVYDCSIGGLLEGGAGDGSTVELLILFLSIVCNGSKGMFEGSEETIAGVSLPDLIFRSSFTRGSTRRSSSRGVHFAI